MSIGHKRVEIRVGIAVGLVALLLSACATTSGPIGVQVREWANGASYSSQNALIVSDLSQINEALRIKDLLGLRTDCDGFGADVQTLYGNLPTPDQTLTNELNDGLENDYEQGAIDCYNAGSLSDSSMRGAFKEFARGTKVMRAARKRLASFGVR